VGAVIGSIGPRIAITLGDPAGVGSEVVLKALSDSAVRDAADWVLVGDHAPLLAAARVTGIAPEQTRARLVSSGALSADSEITWGVLRAEYGRAAAEYVRIATKMCLSGEASAMVTAPLNKEAVCLGGRPFTGHTEYIAELCGTDDPCMLLAGKKLSVAHVSTHTSLRNACRLTVDRVVRTISLGHEALRRMGIAQPRVAVCGLNPHAGEHGLFGSEDAEVIAPAVVEARRSGILCEGPLPADTLFVAASRGTYDLVVAMYHDQGHIPMKLLDFEGTVNVSLGIPIIRTSVDHGTAFDIAGKNRADAANMKAALLMAARMASAPETLRGPV
jgi:4-phospho-D-threonate 3-dehydrogenase / 4-phospho-D-erythronate 3-dehydrogenase